MNRRMLSEKIEAKGAGIAEGVGRRTLLGGGAALIAAVAGAGVMGVRSASAQQTQSDVATPPLPETAATRVTDAQRAWAGSLALQAATFGAQVVAMYNLRATVAFGPKSKAAPGKLWLFDDISTPTIAEESGYVTPNVNVIYGFGFADLGQEPYILTTPNSEGRYYMIEIVDMWNNAFAYPAGEHSGYNSRWSGPAGRASCPPASPASTARRAGSNCSRASMSRMTPICPAPGKCCTELSFRAWRNLPAVPR